jgi:hypothetical protein
VVVKGLIGKLSIPVGLLQQGAEANNFSAICDRIERSDEQL